MSQDWPRRPTGKGKEFPESSLLAGYEDAIWRALAHVDPKEFDRKTGMQMPIREALGKIGLGWVASNSVPVRMVCYEFYKEINHSTDTTMDKTATTGNDSARFLKQ
ncbi:hypothetical protein QTG54_013283 [Skeletonema marinoi]|uniref:Uncharacterized protein n=1 Tax=Skeletonema marinoi TaxID=267567 RepID=A0AAD8XZ55_9STRA|nr:hypothetical protein QTG54_013283 [Skeletonema marinoi]